MNTKQLARLRACHDLARQDRFSRLRRQPLKTIVPYLMRSTGHDIRIETETFFDRHMQVVVPEPVSVNIWRYGFFEEDVCLYLMSLLRPDDTFVDVGGHFGFFSMLGRELVGERGNVVTFEPMPKTREILVDNMSRHRATANQHLVAAAAGAEAGCLTFKDFGLVGSAFATSATQRSSEVTFVGEVQVDVKTLDSVANDLGLESCRLIKIDAENAEYDVIRGGLASIRRLRPALILETGDNNEERSDTRHVLDMLIAEQYGLYEFQDWTIVPHVVRERYAYQNLLLIPKEKVEDMLRPI